VVFLALHFDQLSLEVSADLGEDMPQLLDSFAIENASPIFGHEDQMDVNCENAVSTASKVLTCVHRPEDTLDMERRQAFKFELMPNGGQQNQMRRFAGSCRFVYNKALALQKEMYDLTKRSHTRFHLDKLLTLWKQETPWLSETASHALQQALVDLDRAYTNFFKGRADFPKFHKKGQRSSFRESDPKSITLDQVNSRIRLPKIGWVCYRNSRDVLGQIKNVTVSESCGKWFVSISTLRDVAVPQHPSTSTIGLDWGVVNFITASDGLVVDQCQPLKQFMPKLAKLQRRMARKEKFGQNWKKAKARITKLHSKIANIRKDFVHKVSAGISKNHAVVFVEDLQVKNMSASAAGTKDKPGKMVAQKSGLNRSILDASPFELRRQLECKMLWNGGILLAVPPQNTSRKCPACRHTSGENRKTQARFVCLRCGFSANADWVGSWNIKEAGLALLACSSSSPAVRASCQEPTEATQVQSCA
jgi:putative transposase